MNKPIWIAVAVTVGLVVGGLGVFAWTQSHRPQVEAAAPAQPAGARLALDEALRIATTQVPGEVVKVEREREHGVEIIEIKVLATNGRVRELKLDARDGRVLEIEDD